MKLMIVTDRESFERALSQARAAREPLAGLAAPVAGRIGGMIAEAWDAIEGALRAAYLWGKDRASVAIDEAVRITEDLAGRAGEEVRAFHDELIARMRRYESEFVENTLKQVRSSLRIGDSLLVLENLELSQKIVLGGSLKTSITELCAFTTNSESTIVTKYMMKK
jgi:hypothetical protein